jgi:hypothetical protein
MQCTKTLKCSNLQPRLKGGTRKEKGVEVTMERQFKKCTFVNSLMNRPRFDGGETSAESVTTPAITIPNPKPHVNLNMHNLSRSKRCTEHEQTLQHRNIPLQKVLTQLHSSLTTTQSQQMYCILIQAARWTFSPKHQRVPPIIDH